MAKKSKNNSVNLLKGITGSKLAKLLTIAAIVLAVPLTVFMSQKQQNTEQQAGYVSSIYNIYPISYTKCTAGAGWTTVKKLGITYCAPKCYNYGGRCYDIKKGVPPGYKYVGSGLCPGGSNIRCYKAK